MHVKLTPDYIQVDDNFVPYTISLNLKEFSVNIPCFAKYTSELVLVQKTDENYFYNDPNSSEVAAPLYQQAFQWFADNYDLVSFIYNDDNHPDHHWYACIKRMDGATKCYGGIETFMEAQNSLVHLLLLHAEGNLTF